MHVFCTVDLYLAVTVSPLIGTDKMVLVENTPSVVAQTGLILFCVCFYCFILRRNTEVKDLIN